MLGVFIGVAALIAMVAVGQGANEAVRKQIESLGTNLLVVVPGATTTGGVRGGLRQRLDAHGQRRAGDPARSHRGRQRRLSDPPVRTGAVCKQNWTTSIQGVSPNYPPMTNWQIAAGRSISADDDEPGGAGGRARPDGLSSCSAPIENPVGAIVQVKSVPLRVIGILAAKGQTSFGTDQDDLVMIPFSTAERKVLGVAAPSQQQTSIQLDLSDATQSLWPAAASDRLRQSDLRPGHGSVAGSAGDAGK